MKTDKDKEDIFIESNKLWEQLCREKLVDKNDPNDYNLFIKIITWYHNTYELIPSLKDIAVFLDLSKNSHKIL